MSKTRQIARLLSLREKQVENALKLLDEGATVPFISRYRKEATGGLDEISVGQIADLSVKLDELIHRREFICASIRKQGKLTPELEARLLSLWDATQLEDIYLPFKPKRTTKAEAARKKGLRPLADSLLLKPFQRPEEMAKRHLGPEVKSIDEALQGARDIIAETVSEDEASRQTVRQAFERSAIISSKVVKGKEAEADKYRDYFDWSEPLKRCTSHRLLALRRGEAEGFLRVSIAPKDDEDCVRRIAHPYVRPGSPAAEQVAEAVGDAYKRLLKPSIETEFASLSKLSADAEAIKVFAENLRQLLLAAPLGEKRVMGIDPGFRTGCKVVCLDRQGNLVHNETIYPHPPKCDREGSASRLATLIRQHGIEAVAIGNGTAGRETEDLVKSLGLEGVGIFLVNEDGASVYSASPSAREEFPDYDVTVRGAVSIGRRLADPLAELVKIEPKAIGVGQYQHDVNQKELKTALDRTVELCVNAVGVNLNTASKHLLTYISGLGPNLAQNVVDYRRENGAFSSRRELLKVPRLGRKAYEQCAGFLRIPDAKNPLDNTAVHPERYELVGEMARRAGCDVRTLIASPEKRAAIDLKQYCTEEVGLPTLTDIMAELAKPGRDPRGTAKVFSYADYLHSIADLQVGMEVPGVVTNITNFGCFVDMGIKVKGLIHISNLSDRFVKDPTEVVGLRQQVMVKVLEIDEKRGRIGLKLLQ